MASWADLAKDNRTAAYEVFGHGRWRTCLSRAYYAAYSEAAKHLIRQGVAMPKGREGPSHAKLPELIVDNLSRIGYEIRWKLRGTITQLRDLRIMADYMPSSSVGEDDARSALSLMKQAFDCLGGQS